MMYDAKFTFKAKVWLYAGDSAWHFVSVPVKIAKQIKSLYAGLERGWGSFPVVVTIGTTTWKTSIFPDKKTGTFLLPIKAEVRKKENISVGKTVSIAISVCI